MEGQGEIPKGSNQKGIESKSETLNVIKERINDVDIWFLGVEHTPQFLIKHERAFRDLLQNSVLIVPERFPAEQKEKDFDNFVQDKPGLKGLLDDPQRKFFEIIALVAERKPGKVAVVDPSVIGTSVLRGVLVGGGVIAAGEMIIDFVSYIKEKTWENKKMTRREFLKRAGKTALKGAAAYSLLATEPFPTGLFTGPVQEALGVGDKSYETFGIDDLLSYSGIDFRNVCIAEGLDKLTKSLSGKINGPITVIYGRAHIQPVISYLKDHPQERELKKKTYTPLALLGDQAVRSYEFSNNGWQMTSRENY